MCGQEQRNHMFIDISSEDEDSILKLQYHQLAMNNLKQMTKMSLNNFPLIVTDFSLRKTRKRAEKMKA